MSNRFVDYFGKKEPIEEVKKINVVKLTDFLDNYNIDTKQKMNLIKNSLNNFLKYKILTNINNECHKKL
jgi:hypothetical protein